MKEELGFLLRSLFATEPSSQEKALESFLPPSLTPHIPAATQKPLPFPSLPLDGCHWSWYLPYLRQQAKKDQILFLSALSSSLRENLLYALDLKLPKETALYPVAKHFLQEHLNRQLHADLPNLLPPEALPPSPLNILLGCSKKTLLLLTDALALFDLAQELRHTVQAKHIQKVQKFLHEKEQHFLRSISSVKDAVPWLGLKRWDGAEETFRHLLHKQGLTRLGLALSQEHPHLTWYILHQFDVGRGQALQKLSSTPADPALASQIQEQILTCMQSEIVV